MVFLYLSGLGNVFPEYQDNLLHNHSACVQAQLLSCVRLFVTSWTGARQAPLSMEFSRQEYWGGLPFPTPEDLPDSGTKPVSPALQADSRPLSHWGSPFLGLSILKY